MNSVAVVTSERLARYGFGDGHPFGPDRLAAFSREFAARGLLQRVTLLEPRDASAAELESFHTAEYLEFVRERSASGTGLLDAGDTPAFRGVYEAAAGVVGATLTCMEAIMRGRCRRAFVPIAGLHHAARNRAAGFCVFNDCGVAIEQLKHAGLEHIAYVDIDAHHGDRHEGAAAPPLHDGLHAGERRAHDTGGRLVHTAKGGRIAGIEETRTARRTLAHELQVLGGVERAELGIARIARLEQRDPLRQSARGEFPRECRKSIRSERMAVTEPITREALARDYGDAVHGE